MPYYDPLSTQFMTGGSMQYMPGAQFMTSADYGAYRTLPGADMHTVGQRAPTLWQAYTMANRGGVFGMMDYAVNTYNAGTNQQRQQVMAQRQLADKTSGFAAGVGDLALSAGLGALVSTAFPVTGLAAGMLMPALGGGYVDRIRQARSLQDLSMSKIAGGADMAASLGQGFSMEAASRIGSGIRQTAVDDFIFNQEDFQKITRLGVKSGMFDYSGSAEQYKQTIKKLAGNFKVMMDVFDSADMGEISKSMQRMQRMGARVGSMQSIAGSEAMYSRMAGISHADMVSSYGQAGALAFTQAGLTGYHGSLENMANVASITMMQRTGTISAGDLSRQGGISGASQRLTATKADIMNRLAPSIIPAITNEDGTEIDPAQFEKLMNGEYTFDQLTKISAGKLNTTGKQVQFRKTKAKRLEELWDLAGTAGVDIILRDKAMEIGKGLSPGRSATEQIYAGMMALGSDHKAADMFSEKTGNFEVVAAERDQHRLQELQMKRARYEERKHSRRPWNWAGHHIKRVATELGEDSYGMFSAESAAEKDAVENAKAGVFTVADRGLAATMGDLSKDEIGLIQSFANGTGYNGIQTGTGLHGTAAAAAGRDNIVLQSRWGDQKIRREFIDGVSLSEEDRAAVLEKLGFKSGADAGRYLKAFLGRDSMSQGGLVDLVQQKLNISSEKATQLLAEDDGSMRRFLLAKRSEQSDFVSLRAGVQSDYIEEREDLYKERYNRLNALAKETDKSIINLVGSGAFGLFRDKSAVDAIKGAGSEVGADKAAAAFGALTLQESLTGVVPLGDKTSSYVDAFKEQAGILGLDEKQTANIIDNGRTDVLLAHLEKIGISKNVLKELQAGALEKHSEVSDVGAFRDALGQARSMQDVLSGAQALTSLQSKMSKVLPAGASYSDYINKPELITDSFLSGIQDKGTLEVFKRIKSVQQGDNKLSVPGMAAHLAQQNLISSKAKDHLLSGIKMINPDGTVSEAGEAQRKTAEMLSNHMPDLATNVKKIADSVEKDSSAKQRRQETTLVPEYPFGPMRRY